MKLNLSDNKVIALLVTALILQILLLLWHMDLIGFSNKATDEPSGVLAGTVENIENTLKRRPLDSLIWEESRAPEKVYFHDSILTLSESTARIQLQNGTQINLSENTLITIEPESENSSGEIRIRMAQGNLKARNPYQKAVVQDELTSVKIEADSDVDLVKSENGQVEVLVNKGKAEVVHKDQSYEITKNERMVLTKEDVKKDKMSESLRWENELLNRYYTHKLESFLKLKWKGSAKHLIVESRGKILHQEDLAPGQNEWQGSLTLGQYHVYLKGEEGQSKSKEVQVWQAPKIQLVSPRPRDRVKTGSLPFVWTPQKEVESYELIIKGEGETLRFPTSLNKTNEKISREGDFQWEVWGVDQKGFKIPPAYDYPLYIRENPFAPPKLNKPKLFKEKENLETSWWNFLIFSKAWANPERVAIFSWETVPGANLYFIEISQDKEFRSTVVKEKLKEPLYHWKNFKENETYYWRVAAGDQSGRMGLFSEPTLVDWDYVLPPKPVEKVLEKPSTPKIVKRPTPPPQPPAPPPPPPLPVVKKDPPPPPPPQDLGPRHYFRSASLFYMPGFGLKNYTENGTTKANLQGVNIVSGGAELEFDITRQSTLRWYSKFQQLEYEPQPKNAFPFQPNVQTRTWINHLLWAPQNSQWGVGAWLGDLPTLKRESFEQVDVQQESVYGVMGDLAIQWGPLQWIGTLGLLTSSQKWGATSSQRFLVPLWLEGLRVGLEIEAIYLNGDSNNDTLLDAYLLLGWKF